jgi:ABC-type multidrug transport system fused ATPase/permease subunit
MNPLIVFGFNNVVTRQNIYALTFQHLTRTTYEDFVDTKKYINQYKVLRRIYSSNKREIWSQFMFSTIACFVSYLSPFFQQKFLQYIELKENRPPIQIAYLYVLSMFLVGIIKLLCNSIQLWMGRRWNIRTMMMLDSEIFSKTLRRKDTSGKISKDAKEEKDTADNGKKKKDKKEAEQESGSFSNIGKITNLMSVDADKLSDIPAYIFVSFSVLCSWPVLLFIHLYLH